MTANANGERLVLVVDDDTAVRQMLDMILQMEGYTVLQAADGFEAVELYGKHRPRAVVLDIMMPNLNGLEVLDRIKKMHESDGQMPPVIVVSARGTDDDQWEGYRRGASCYIAKPVEPEELIGLLNKLVK